MRNIFVLIISFFVHINPCWADIRDIAPPVDFPSNDYPFYLLLIVLGSTLIVSLINFILKRFKKLKPQGIKPSWVIADERLEELRNRNLPSGEKIKEYYTLLSDIVRRFMEARFSVRVPEMTTQEFLGYIRDSCHLNSEHNELLKEFLNSCDMVKFAKYGPSLKETETSFYMAKKLINALKEPTMIALERAV